MTRAGSIEAALTGIALVAWACMIRAAGAMEAAGVGQCAGMAISGPEVKPWNTGAIIPFVLMWAEMGCMGD
jgi:hypothetical protein